VGEVNGTTFPTHPATQPAVLAEGDLGPCQPPQSASYDQNMTGDKPFPRIVVPTDGSQLSLSAVDAAAALARRVGVPVTLFSVAFSESVRDSLVDDLYVVADSIDSDLVVDVVVEVAGAAMTVGAYVAEAILEEADTDGALVCIASHGHRGLGAALLGSTAEEVLRMSSRPVLVVGPRYEPRALRDDGMVVACVDGSPFAEQVLPVAAAWSATLGEHLWFVEVTAPNTDRAPRADSPGTLYETAYLRSLTQGDPHIDFDVLHSTHPAHELAELPSRWPVDLLVMATHGRSGWPRLTLGSVAMNVVHRATCPVLVVRPVGAVAGTGIESVGSKR
jgi:nucleotide-binding universal stress UspA family protein